VMTAHRFGDDVLEKVLNGNGITHEWWVGLP
jgi:hypothetical protein